MGASFPISPARAQPFPHPLKSPRGIQTAQPEPRTLAYFFEDLFQMASMPTVSSQENYTQENNLAALKIRMHCLAAIQTSGEFNYGAHATLTNGNSPSTIITRKSLAVSMMCLSDPTASDKHSQSITFSRAIPSVFGLYTAQYCSSPVLYPCRRKNGILQQY